MALRRQLVVFKVGAEEFAADILLTKEVVVMREITPIPDSRNYVEGVMNLRGSLVPVLDFRKRLRARGVAPCEDGRIIIANLDGRLAGLIVDGASEVIRVTDEMIEPAPEMLAEVGAGYVTGVVNLSGRFVTLVDLKKALTDEITCELDEVIGLLAGDRGPVVGPVQVVKG